MSLSGAYNDEMESIPDFKSDLIDSNKKNLFVLDDMNDESKKNLERI